jgi:hypothetical protein
MPESINKSSVATYAETVSPDELRKRITTDAEQLWTENEQLFLWLLSQVKTNWLLRTVPGGGKSYVKETIVPQLAAGADKTFVLATTEYRNRQETYRAVLKTLIDHDLVHEVNVVYVPSPRERYGDIPRLEADGDWTVTTPDDDKAVCQTFTEDDDEEYVYDVARELDAYISRGATTGAIHNAASSEWEQIVKPKYIDEELYPLPCQQEGQKRGYDPTDPESEPACRHRRMIQQRMEQIEHGGADIIICGASLLNKREVVADATVIMDEDVSGELIETHHEDYLEAATENYLSSIDIGPDGYWGALRASDDVKAEVSAYIHDHHAPRSELAEDDDKEPLVNRNAPVKAESYDYNRAEAPLLTLALMEGEDTVETNHIVFDPDDIPYTVVIDLTKNNINNSHDAVAIASPPQPLQGADQVMALDATGSKAWWELLTEITFESASPNPLDERGAVVSEAFDIEFRSLTENMVPINRPNNLSPREFLGILQAIVDHHGADEVSVVTSKAMRDKVLDSEYADEVMELAYAEEILYFGGLRSDRTFEESRLHVVIGAPHPGDDAVRQRMALLGYDDEIIQDNYAIRGEDRYKGQAKTVLKNMVHSEVYQAARRAARDTDREETAFVYLYTRMFDETLIEADDTYTIDIGGRGEKQKGGTEAILTTLDHADQPLRTPEVVERVNDRLDDGTSLSRRRVLEKLNGLAEKDLVGKRPWTGRSKRWTLDVPPRHGTLKRTERAEQ